MEDKMRLAETIMERLGAVPLDINRKNREILGQRVTYQMGDTYYRVDQAEFDDQPFVIISAINDPHYADIGLMEDVEAIAANAPEETYCTIIRQAMGLDEGES